MVAAVDRVSLAVLEVVQSTGETGNLREMINSRTYIGDGARSLLESLDRLTLAILAVADAQEAQRRQREAPKGPLS
ncbi:MAG: hypothetical protein ACYC5O_05985 [Anaerolineae bacterium]